MKTLLEVAEAAVSVWRDTNAPPESTYKAMSALAMAVGAERKRTEAAPQKGPKTLKLYVWDGAFADYTGGCGFAMAYDVEQARRLICKENGTSRAAREVKGKPAVHRAPKGYVIYGGG